MITTRCIGKETHRMPLLYWYLAHLSSQEKQQVTTDGYIPYHGFIICTKRTYANTRARNRAAALIVPNVYVWNVRGGFKCTLMHIDIRQSERKREKVKARAHQYIASWGACGRVLDTRYFNLIIIFADTNEICSCTHNIFKNIYAMKNFNRVFNTLLHIWFMCTYSGWLYYYSSYLCVCCRSSLFLSFLLQGFE